MPLVCLYITPATNADQIMKLSFITFNYYGISTFTALWANSADDNLMTFFLIFFSQKTKFDNSCKPVCMKCRTLFSGKRNKTIFQNAEFVFFDWATGICDYWFCKHSVENCRGESYYQTIFFEEYEIVSLISCQSETNQMTGNPHTTCCILVYLIQGSG